MDGTEIAWTIIACTFIVWPAAASRFWKKKKEQPPNQPICGCKHHRSYHEGGKSACHAMVKGKPLQYDVFDEPTSWDKVQCTCQHYSGPEPLPQFYAPEITDE